MNITEKILSKKAGHDVIPGEIIEIDVDLAMSHDGTSPPTIKSFEKITDKVWDNNKIAIVFDHNIPANTIGSAEFQKTATDFIKKQKIKNHYTQGDGICHQVLPEKGLVEPGKVIVGADSHTCSYGAFGAFSTGMGATDLAMVYATGKTWFMVPESLKIEVEGTINNHIKAKDIILHIIGEIGSSGATYKSVEYCGEAINQIDIEGRQTICNMSIEMGAKNGIIAPNEEVLSYVSKRTNNPIESLDIVTSDPDTNYSKEYLFNIDNIEQQIACPNDVDNVKPISKVEGTGAIICNPGCGPCLGGHMGVLSKNEVCISTTNRNFKGRMGDPQSKVYLSNSEVVAASAIEGVITNPENLI
jgi:methanogen homoaconitase large subunit